METRKKLMIMEQQPYSKHFFVVDDMVKTNGGLHGGLVGLRQRESKPYVKMSETALKTKKQNVNPN
jgi:hypothetical protein